MANQGRKLVRLTLYAFLFVSAATAFWFDDKLWSAVRTGNAPVWTALLPATTFTLFVLAYAADRWLLVRRQSYPPARAFFQVALAIVFLTLLWPGQPSKFREAQMALRARQAASSTEFLLAHPQPRVRAATCDLLGKLLRLGEHGAARQKVEAMGQRDPSDAVRLSCQRAARGGPYEQAGLDPETPAED